MAWYPGAIRKEVTRHRTPMARYRGVCNHVAVSEAASLFGYFNTPDNPTSHFYVRKDGKIEQYVDTAYRAPAQLEGNPSMISIETQGGVDNIETEPWTDAQVETLAGIARWAHELHGIPLVRMADSLPATRGIGYHRLGIDPWRVDGGELWSKSFAKSCPGNAKIAQINTIIARAILGGTMALTNADIQLLLAYEIPTPTGTKTIQACLGEASVANDAHASILNVAKLFNEGGSIKELLDVIKAGQGTIDYTRLAASLQPVVEAGVRAVLGQLDGH